MLNRTFCASRPNEKWVTDVTEFSLFGQQLYLSPNLDLYNSEVIIYTLSQVPRFSAVISMVDDALEKLPQEHNLILHSDQGWQYQIKLHEYIYYYNHHRTKQKLKGMSPVYYKAHSDLLA